MLFSQVALTVATLVGSSMAADKFLLKTSASTISEFNDLYVLAYHTGAGTADAVLTSDATSAGQFSLSGSRVSASTGNVSSSIELGSDVNYAAWEFANINIGPGSPGFYLNQDGALLSNASGWDGWIACDWWHGVPQLFWTDSYYDLRLPSSCSTVTLSQVATA